MATENPFFLAKVECPICKTINEFESIRVGAYTEHGRDTDFCPLDIRWKAQRFQGHTPLAYFTATCGNCLYTREFTNSFKEWKKDNTFKMYRLKVVKEKHLDHLARADSVIRSLGEAIDLARSPGESAIVKLHLAIFDELLADHYTALDVGRFYLRIGWIFRDMEKGENPSLSFLKGLMREIDNQYNSFKKTLKTGRDQKGVFLRHVTSHFETDRISSEVKSQMLPYREKLCLEIEAIGESLSEADTKLTQMQDLIAEYHSTTLGGDGKADGAFFRGFPSFVDFLFDCKCRWDHVVANEQEALERAVQYYKAAFEGGRDISSGNQQIQASYLIAELSRRIGDHDGAREYFNTTIKHGQAFVYENRRDQSRTALARKILELATEQGKTNMASLKAVKG